MVDEKKHPRTERFKRRHGGSKALFGCRKLFDFAAVAGLDEGIAGWEVAVERARADTGLAGDIVEAGGGAVAGKDPLGDLKDILAPIFDSSDIQ